MRVALPLAACLALAIGIAAGTDASAEEDTDRASVSGAKSEEARLTAQLLTQLVSNAKKAEGTELQKRGPPVLCNGGDMRHVKALKLKLTGRVSDAGESDTEETSASSGSFLMQRGDHFLDTSEAAAWGGGSHDQGNTRTDLWALSLAQTKLSWLCSLDWHTRDRQERMEALAEHREGLQDILEVYGDERPDSMYMSESQEESAEPKAHSQAPQYSFVSATQVPTAQDSFVNAARPPPAQHPLDMPVALSLPLPPDLSTGQILLPTHIEDSSSFHVVAPASQPASALAVSAVATKDSPTTSAAPSVVKMSQSTGGASDNQVLSTVQLDKPALRRAIDALAPTTNSHDTVSTTIAPKEHFVEAPAPQVANSPSNIAARTETAKIDMELRREIRDAGADGAEAAAADEGGDDAVVTGDVVMPDLRDAPAEGDDDAVAISPASESDLDPDTSMGAATDALDGSPERELVKLKAENSHLRSALTQQRYSRTTARSSHSFRQEPESDGFSRGQRFVDDVERSISQEDDNDGTDEADDGDGEE